MPQASHQTIQQQHRLQHVKQGKNKRLADRSPEKAQKRPALGNITNVTNNFANEVPLVDKVKIPDDPKKPNYKSGRKTTVTVIQRNVPEVKAQKAVHITAVGKGVTGGSKDVEADDTEYIILSSQESNEQSSQDSNAATTAAHKLGSQTSDKSPVDKDEENVDEKMARLLVDDRITAEAAVVRETLPEGVVNIDKEYYGALENVPAYARDVFTYLRRREVKFCTSCPPGAEASQSVRRLWKKRENIIKWFTQVQEEFGLNHETMYHGIKLFDLYLNHLIADRQGTSGGSGKATKLPEKTAEIALIAGATFFMACKCDDQLCPSLDHFVDALEQMCTRNEVMAMERRILAALQFDINVPHAYEFLRRYGKCIQMDMPSITLARYVLETVNMSQQFLPLLDSLRAAAALYLALNILEHQHRHWGAQLQHYSGYRREQLVAIAQAMNDTLRQHLALREAAARGQQPDVLNPILQKYSHPVFFKVAEVPLIENDALNHQHPAA